MEEIERQIKFNGIIKRGKRYAEKANRSNRDDNESKYANSLLSLILSKNFSHKKLFYIFYSLSSKHIYPKFYSQNHHG